MSQVPQILVIDDDQASARLVEVAFRTTMARIVTQTRSFGVLERIAEVRPVLVILDVTMPGLDGPSIVELIRQDPELRETRVILWSALAREDLERRAEACGADAALEKIAGPLALVTKVTHLLIVWDGVEIARS